MTRDEKKQQDDEMLAKAVEECHFELMDEVIDTLHAAEELGAGPLAMIDLVLGALCIKLDSTNVGVGLFQNVGKPKRAMLLTLAAVSQYCLRKAVGMLDEAEGKEFAAEWYEAMDIVLDEHKKKFH